MDGLPQSDMERLIFFEAEREKCAAEYLRSPHDPENLTKWGSALLELSQFQQGEESMQMIEESISKLEAALQINPKRHKTLWSLGQAHTCQGLLLPVGLEANEHFKKAGVCFQDAYTEEPCDLYMKSLEMSQKAPALHEELQTQLNSQGLFASPSSGSSGGNKKASRRNELTYDILGWVVLAMGIVAWIGMANLTKPPPVPK